MPEKEDRPELTIGDAKEILRTATIIVNSKGRKAIVGTVVLLMAENMRLTKEINVHREKLGFELLPTHDPKIN